MRPLDFMAGGLLLVASMIPASSGYGAEILKPHRTFEVAGDFIGKDGAAAEDLSGIACTKLSGSSSPVCLVINDENASAQFATIIGERLVPGEQVPVFNHRQAIGAPPLEHHCTGGPKKFKDLDGEGVAFAGRTFYVIGSHGCSRRDDEFRPSAFVLSRIRLEEGDHSPVIDHTYRLSEALATATTIGPYFAKPLEAGANGLNIEGIAIHGQDLLVGLRAPTIAGKAFIVIAPLGKLFSAETGPIEARVRELSLGEGVGIRDMASLPDGRVLILSGPAQRDFATSQDLFVLDAVDGPPIPVGRLAPPPNLPEKAQAEAVTIIGSERERLRVLVLYDGVANGAPSEVLLPLGPTPSRAR